jgi:hypothetical protein
MKSSMKEPTANFSILLCLEVAPLPRRSMAVLSMPLLRIQVFWHTKLFRVSGCECHEGVHCFHLHGSSSERRPTGTAFLKCLQPLIQWHITSQKTQIPDCICSTNTSWLMLLSGKNPCLLCESYVCTFCWQNAEFIHVTESYTCSYLYHAKS